MQIKRSRRNIHGIAQAAGLIIGLGLGCSGGSGGEESESGGSSGGAQPLCANPAQTCTIAYTCNADCGQGQPFDADGCLRTLCTNDDGCGGGERCMIPGYWGSGCMGSDFACADEAGACACDDGGGCDGGYCISEMQWPAEMEHQVGPVSVTDTCEPGDGLAVMISIGDMNMPGWVLINIWEPAPLSVGEHSAGGLICVDSEGETFCAGGIVEITSWEGGLVSGSYRGLVLGRVEGTFTDAPYMQKMLVCA